MTKKQKRRKQRAAASDDPRAETPLDPIAVVSVLQMLSETLDPEAAPPEPQKPTRMYHNVPRPPREAHKWQPSDDPQYLYMTSDYALQRQKLLQPKAKPKRDGES